MKIRSNSCENDFLEPNDSPDTAVEISSSYDNLQVCKDNPDWYKVNLTNGQPLTVTVAFAKEIGTIFMEIYDQNFNIMATSFTSNGQQQITITTTPQIYYIHVFLNTEIPTGKQI